MFQSLFTKSFWSIEKTNVLSFILLLFFASEFLTKLLDFLGVEQYRVGVLIKVAFLCYVLVRKIISINLFLALSALLSLFTLSQVFIETGYSFREKILRNSLYFAKYTFIFILADYINKIDYKNIQIKKTLKIILILLRINFVLIVIGVAFKIDLFRTYDQYRFGYNGLIQMNSHATYLYCFATIYVLYNYLEKKKVTLDLLMIVISGLLVGTKTIWLFYTLISIYLFFSFKLYKKLMFYLTISAVILVIYVSKDLIFHFFTTNLSGYIKLYNESGLLTAITSNRNLLLADTIALAIKFDWGFINFLIGGGFFHILRTEMSFVDLFLFWGIIGTSLYLYLHYKHVVIHYMHHSFLNYAIICVFISAFFGGNYFTNAVTAMYILVFSNFFSLKKEKEDTMA